VSLKLPIYIVYNSHTQIVKLMYMFKQCALYIIQQSLALTLRVFFFRCVRMTFPSGSGHVTGQMKSTWGHNEGQVHLSVAASSLSIISSMISSRQWINTLNRQLVKHGYECQLFDVSVW